MVDEGRVARLLRSVTERTGRIRSAGDGLTPEDQIRLDALKYQLVTAAEACVDDRIVLGAVGRVAEFDSFVEQVGRWLLDRR